MQLTDATRRAIRTAQVFVAAAIPGIPTFAALFNVPAGRVAQITAAIGALTVMFTKARNELEDRTRFPAVLKAEPSPGLNPVPDDQPAVEPAPPKRKPRRRVTRDDGQSLVYVLVAAILIIVLIRLLTNGAVW